MIDYEKVAVDVSTMHMSIGLSHVFGIASCTIFLLLIGVIADVSRIRSAA